MKLLRFGKLGSEKPGILDNAGRIRDLSAHIDDIAGSVLLPEGLHRLQQIDIDQLPIVADQPRIGACVNPMQVRNLIGIGRNYAKPGKENSHDAPTEPIVFSKLTSSISGPYDPIVIPRHSEKTDWEVELGVVIGKPAKYVTEAQALDHVAGYCIVNDLSEREWQFSDGAGQFLKGKSPDTFSPIGPWLVTPDEIADVQNLDVWLEVDGHRYQNDNTQQMIFTVAHLISYCSQYFTLQTGDIIATGTPAGIGNGIKPEPIYLKPGQTVRLGVSGLGEQIQKAVKEG